MCKKKQSWEALIWSSLAQILDYFDSVFCLSSFTVLQFRLHYWKWDYISRHPFLQAIWFLSAEFNYACLCVLYCGFVCLCVLYYGFVCVFCTMDLFVLYHGYVCVFCNIDMFVCSALWICLFVCSVLRICLCVLYYGYVCVLKGTWAKEAPLALLIQMDRKWTQHLFVFSLLSRPVC